MNSMSLLPFRPLWVGNIGVDYYYVCGHNDGQISWFRDHEYNVALKACRMSTALVIYRPLPPHVLEIVTPVPNGSHMVMTRLKVQTHQFVLGNARASFRVAHDKQNNTWLMVTKNLMDVSTFDPYSRSLAELAAELVQGMV
jgi:hypothetical protein